MCQASSKTHTHFFHSVILPLAFLYQYKTVYESHNNDRLTCGLMQILLLEEVLSVRKFCPVSMATQ